MDNTGLGRVNPMMSGVWEKERESERVPNIAEHRCHRRTEYGRKKSEIGAKDVAASSQLGMC